MSKIGYYRLKTTATDGRVVTFYKSGIASGVATIKTLDFCSGYRILKYLDSKGRYRFFSFTNYYEVNDRPQQIGTTNEFITNILNAQTNSKNLGYRNERTLSLSAEVDSEQLEVLSEIYTSPRVYLYVGNGTSDTLADWVELSEITGDNIVRRRKQKTGVINLQAKLPEWFTIKQI